MSRSKREQQLKENERYPFRSLTTEQRQAFDHEEELAERRERAAQKRRDERREHEKELAARRERDAKKREEEKKEEESRAEKVAKLREKDKK